MYLFKHNRKSKSLNGTWEIIPDPYEEFDDRKIYKPKNKSRNDIPLDFNVDDGYSVNIPISWGEAITEFRYYEGWMWHVKKFGWEDRNERVFLRFGAVNYRAEVWLNGQRLGIHEGGFTPFSFEVTDYLKKEGQNLLVVLVDNKRGKDNIPGIRTDWFNFGGIHRPVELISVPRTFIRNYKFESSLVEDKVKLRIEAWIDGPDGKSELEFKLPELNLEKELKKTGDSKFTGEFVLPKNKIKLWTTERPNLYDITLSYGRDHVKDKVGIREIKVENGKIVLNGKDVWLRGISMHEEEAGKGRALSKTDVEKRFERLEQLNCNFARLAHYPHTPQMPRKADEEGILLWEEVPAWQNISFEKEEVRNLHRQQLREMIQRDWNRPSIILWSIANETDPKDEMRNEALREMADYVKKLDSSRLVTAACFINENDERERIYIDDPLEDSLDVIGINEYYGWYYGEADDMEKFDEDPQGTPVVISETGGGARWGKHGSEDERWTEEYQERIYRNQLKAIEQKEQVKGISPWILFDFRTPVRMNEYQRGYNRKGLMNETGRKKRAFYTLKQFYQEKQQK